MTGKVTIGELRCLSPPNPDAALQAHVYSPFAMEWSVDDSVQVPSWWHGLGSHSFTSRPQFFPPQPLGQVAGSAGVPQLYPVPVVLVQWP